MLFVWEKCPRIFFVTEFIMAADGGGGAGGGGGLLSVAVCLDAADVRAEAFRVQSRAASDDALVVQGCAPLTDLRLPLCRIRLAEAAAATGSGAAVSYLLRSSHAVRAAQRAALVGNGGGGGGPLFLDGVAVSTAVGGSALVCARASGPTAKRLTRLAEAVAAELRNTPLVASVAVLERMLVPLVRFASHAAAVSVASDLAFVARAETSSGRGELRLCRGPACLASVPPPVVPYPNHPTPYPPPPVVLVMRGVPGSGKSTTCRAALATLGLSLDADAVVCGADAFFEERDAVTGALLQYNWAAHRLGQAHKWCRHRFEEALLERRHAVVVVDNVSARRWTYREYTSMALANSSEVVVIDLRCPDQAAVEVCAGRNAHGVALKGVLKMWQSWEKDPRAVVVPAPCDAAAVHVVAVAVREALERTRTRWGAQPGGGSVSIMSVDDSVAGGERKQTTSLAPEPPPPPPPLPPAAPPQRPALQLRQASAEAAINSRNRLRRPLLRSASSFTPSSSSSSSSSHPPTHFSALPEMGRRLLALTLVPGKAGTAGGAGGAGAAVPSPNMGKASLMYAAAFLDQASRRSVLSRLGVLGRVAEQEAQGAVVVAHHVTMGFRPTPDDYRKSIAPLLGKLVRFRCLRVLQDENIVALLLERTAASPGGFWARQGQVLHLTCLLRNGAAAKDAHSLAKRAVARAAAQVGAAGNDAAQGLTVTGMVGVAVRRRGRMEILFDPHDLEGWRLK